MRYWMFCLCSLCVFTNVCAQPEVLDSLKKALPSLPKDSNDAVTLILISFEYRSQNLDTSVLWARKALDFSRKIHYANGTGSSLSMLAQCAFFKGDYPTATQYYLEALRLFEKIGKKISIGQSLEGLAMIHNEQTDYTEALDWYRKAERVYGQIPDSTKLANVWTNMGTTYARMHHYDTALKLHTQALTIYVRQNNTYRIAYVYMSLADVATSTHKPQEAIRYYTSALQLVREMQDDYGAGTCLTGLAVACEQLNDLKASESYARQAIPKIQQTDTSMLITVYQTLYSVEKKRGNYQQALYYQDNYYTLEKLKFDQENRRTITRLQDAYAIEKQKLENQSLRKDKVIREKTLKSQQIQIWMLVTGIFFVLSLAIVLYRNTRTRRRTNLVLQQQNVEIIEKTLQIEQYATDLITANENLQQINLHLDEMVQKRTRKLQQQNEQLIQYQWMNAHKVRGPLSRILGLLELIQYTGTDEEQEELIGYMDQSAKELDTIIQDIQLMLQKK